LRLLGINLRVLRLEVSVWTSKTIGREYGFLSGFPPSSFTVYSKFTEEIHKRLRGKAVECRGDCEYSKEENS
jgi:hypothetical protein